MSGNAQVYLVETTLKDADAVVLLSDDGVVTCGNPARVIAQCEPTSPVFGAFMSFWSGQFVKHRHTLAYKQLLQGLIDGDLMQDADCPVLFIDKTFPIKAYDKDPAGNVGYKILEARDDGQVKNYNPDGLYIKDGYALISNPRLKFYHFTHDMEDSDMPEGIVFGISLKPGEKPVYDRSKTVPWYAPEKFHPMADEFYAEHKHRLP